MILKFTVACVFVFAILAFLKFVEDSPIHSWKAVFLTGIPLSIIVCFWVKYSFPPPPPPAPKIQKVAAYEAELERTFRRIEGVGNASINGSVIEIDFREEKPIEKLKEIAQRTSGTAAHFLRLSKTNRMTIYIKVHGHYRYQMEYSTTHGIVSETIY